MDEYSRVIDEELWEYWEENGKLGRLRGVDVAVGFEMMSLILLVREEREGRLGRSYSLGEGLEVGIVSTLAWLEEGCGRGGGGDESGEVDRN